MSPDSPQPSRRRTWWRFIACLGSVLAAFSLLVSVWLYTQQQSSREDSVRTSCLEQNARHDRTVKALDELLAGRAREHTGPERRRIRQARANTLPLIDALSPRRNCEQRVELLTQQGTLQP